MAGFVIAAVAGVLPFALGAFGLGRARIVLVVGGVVAFGWLLALSAKPPDEVTPVPLWYVCGMVILLYLIWCGGFWLGLRFRRIRRPSPG